MRRTGVLELTTRLKRQGPTLDERVYGGVAGRRVAGADRWGACQPVQQPGQVVEGDAVGGGAVHPDLDGEGLDLEPDAARGRPSALVGKAGLRDNVADVVQIAEDPVTPGGHGALRSSTSMIRFGLPSRIRTSSRRRPMLPDATLVPRRIGCRPKESGRGRSTLQLQRSRGSSHADRP